VSKDIIQFLNVAKSAVASMRIRSALNPFLFLIMVVGAIMVSVVSFGSLPLLGIYGLLVLFSLVVVATLGVGIYFAIHNPDLLRSEEFQIKKQSLELLGAKGTELMASGEHVTLIANPQAEAGTS
jgi:membrane protein YdbS with pleckstrin-like domain